MYRSIKLIQIHSKVYKIYTLEDLMLISCFLAAGFAYQEDDKPEPSAPQANTVELTAY